MIEFDRRRLLLGFASAGGVLSLEGCDLRAGDKDAVVTRVGWQTAWASQGQVMQALINTNIAKLTGASLGYKGFQYGPDLNEAAVSNSIDVTNAGIVPVVNLLAKSPDWMIVGRQTDFYVSIIGRPGANIKTVADLKGRKFGVPIGGGSHPFAIAKLKEAGLKEGDVKVVNVPPTEMLLAFKKGDVDAVAVWDPTAQLIVEAGGNIVAEQAYVGFTTASRALLNRKGAAEHMLEAMGLAYLYAAKNKAQTDAWFAKASGMPLDLVSRLRVIEPNLKATTLAGIKLAPTDAAVALCQEVADAMLDLGLLKAKLDVRSRVVAEPAKTAEAALAGLEGKYSQISAA